METYNKLKMDDIIMGTGYLNDDIYLSEYKLKYIQYNIKNRLNKLMTNKYFQYNYIKVVVIKLISTFDLNIYIANNEIESLNVKIIHNSFDRQRNCYVYNVIEYIDIFRTANYT